MATDSRIGLIWEFLRARKKWWLAPIIIFTLLIGLLIAVTASNPAAPFIYTLF